MPRRHHFHISCRATTSIVIIFCSFILSCQFASAQQPRQSQQRQKSQPRLLQNPGSSSSWDVYNANNDFLLRDPIIDDFSSQLPITIVKSTSISSSSSKTNGAEIQTKSNLPSPTSNGTPLRKNSDDVNQMLGTLEDDLIQMINEENVKLEKFINHKIQSFEEKLKVYENSTLLGDKQFADLYVRLETLSEVQENNSMQTLRRSDSTEFLPHGFKDDEDDQTQLAMEFANWLNSFIQEYDTYKIFTPIANSIQAFRNSKKRSFQLENRMQRRSSESECGGIVLGDAGEIAFSPPEDDEFYPSRCIWTLRVTSHQQIAFNLIEDNFPSGGRDTYLAIHTLTSIPKLYFGFFSFKDAGNPGIKGPVVLRHNDKSDTIVDGPVVFITLVSSMDKIAPSFKLKFESIGLKIPIDSVSPVKYNHFHYTDLDGVIDYPKTSWSWLFGTGKWYRGPEIATFTISPQQKEKINSINIFVDDISI
ncbi:hypothetical protein Fcan01_06544, partial [Folsomia candida]